MRYYTKKYLFLFQPHHLFTKDRIFYWKKRSSKIPAVAIYNYIPNHKNKYILFLDYDNIPLSTIKDECVHIQAKYDIGDIHIINTNANNYHAISFDIFTKQELWNILKNTTTDYNHRRALFLHQGQALRITPKNEYPLSRTLTLYRESKRTKSNQFLHLYQHIGLIPSGLNYKPTIKHKYIRIKRYIT